MTAKSTIDTRETCHHHTKFQTGCKYFIRYAVAYQGNEVYLCNKPDSPDYCHLLGNHHPSCELFYPEGQ